MITSSRQLATALLVGVMAMACTVDPISTPTSATPTPVIAVAPSTTTMTAFLTSAASAGASTCPTPDGVNDGCSCDADAKNYCSGFYTTDWQSFARANGYTTASWKLGLLDCLGKQNVSAACSASLGRREVLNANLMTACRSYCRGTAPQPGADPCADKLRSIYDSLDNACRAAFDAHQGAIPISNRR